ncbi:MAG: FecR domain-containing protein [Alphaproteobacteria bacterium]|nr:FecR domain-containing protein [Alphaproteobacteria bacterium]
MSEDVLYDGSGVQLAQAGADPIGIVVTSTGTVTVERADGTVDQLSAGDPVYEDDVLTTGDGSTVGIRFQDDSRFSLGEEGRMELDTFVYDAGAGTGSSLIDVAQGSFAFVSGMIAKTGDDAMSVQTPVATIGVRGTTVAGDVGPDGQTEVTLLPDTDGTLGEIAVFNQSGLQIMFDAFQRVDIGGSDIAPTAPRTIEPSELRPDIADTVRAIGADPSGGAAPPAEDEDGGGSDPVDDAVSPDAQTENPDMSEEIDTAADGVELPGEDVAELTESDMEAAAEEVAEIEVSAGGDRAIIRMADGRAIEVDATELESGTVVGPNGSVITIDTVPSGVGRGYDRALAAEEEEDRAATPRETPNTFHNEALATGESAAAINTLGNSGDFALNFSPEILQSLQNALDAELEPPAGGRKRKRPHRFRIPFQATPLRNGRPRKIRQRA